MKTAWMMLTAFVLTCLVAVPANGEIMYKDVPDSIESYSGPTIYLCVAYAANRQRCKSCEPYFDAVTGNINGMVCAYVDASRGCSCDSSPACKETRGKCTYK